MEIPRGFGEEGIDAETQAKQELFQETGIEKINRLISLGIYFNNTGIEGNPIYLFLAKIPYDQEVKIKLEKKEAIRSKK